MYTQNDNQNRVAVVGGGAAGLFATAILLEHGVDVTLFEHMPRTGTKLLITGKGRCNVTNNCTPEEVLNNVVTNPRFLYSALSNLTPQDVMTFFEGHGVPLKTERGQRVFPVSDQSQDIVNALRQAVRGATLVKERVTALLLGGTTIQGVRAGRDYAFDKVLLATGGLSYPKTGSDGSGYTLAQQAGHTIVAPTPSLVPLTSPDGICREMQGLSLRNVGLTVKVGGKKLYEDFGEMLFTHFGVSGPMVLSASARMKGVDFGHTVLQIDLKPALDEKALDARLLSDFAKNANRDFINELGCLLPQKMLLPFAQKVGIDPHKKVPDITKEERRRLLTTLKAFTIRVNGFRPIEEAIITSGGVSCKEVNPKTMMSKLVEGLYFAGEILDVDAYTGGFNLQIAFSTAHLAAKAMAGI